MRRSLSLLRLVAVLLLISIGSASADVRMPALFGTHMVLQQDLTLPVWGWADPGEQVTVAIGGQTAATKAGADGKWRVDLKKMAVNSEPQTMTVTGKNTLKFDDVLVGDVWICSGQSNMVFGYGSSGPGEYRDVLLKRGEKMLDPNFPKIRLFFVTKSGRNEPQDNVDPAPSDSPLQGSWQVCSPEMVQKLCDFTDQDEHGFSAVGYMFAAQVHLFIHQPVGMIGSYLGATGVDAWSSLEGLQKEPLLVEHYVDPLNKLATYPTLDWATYVTAFIAWRARENQWEAEAKKAKDAGQPEPPKSPDLTPPHNPGFGVATASLFNGMIHPLIPYGIKGVVWYQGENDVGRTDYGLAFSNLIKDWRAHWGQGDFTFLFVQLPNEGKAQAEIDAKSEYWPRQREYQATALALPNVGMAVTIDIGDEDIHPRDKFDVAKRLALAAEKVAYGSNAVTSGPTFEAMKIEGNKVRVSFQNIGTGLKIGISPLLFNQTPETELKGFLIAGEDHKFVRATAKIDGNDVIVWSDAISNPQAVRYAWEENPICNLYNKENLPAAPFRTDKW